MVNGKNDTKKIPPLRRKNKDVRSREHLTEAEIEKLLEAAKNSGKLSHRNYTAVLIAYRHGLRNKELCDLRWESVDLDRATVYVIRQKGSKSGVHPLARDEVRALSKLRKLHPKGAWVFQTQTGDPLSERVFHKIVAELGVKAGLPFTVHPHMLRHSCGYTLINKVDMRVVQDWLGHSNIASTVIYTALRPDRFKGMWE